MTPEQQLQFYLQIIAAIFAGLTPLVMGALALWLKARMNRQDDDRATKTEDIKTHIDIATNTTQTPATLVEKTDAIPVAITDPTPKP